MHILHCRAAHFALVFQLFCWETVRNVHCAVCVCTVHTLQTLLVKKYCIRMLMKSLFNPARQNSTLYLEKQKSAKCALCSAKCALCSGVRSDLIALFKWSQKKKLMLKISLESVENWKMLPNKLLSLFAHFPFLLKTKMKKILLWKVVKTK